MKHPELPLHNEKLSFNKPYSTTEEAAEIIELVLMGAAFLCPIILPVEAFI